MSDLFLGLVTHARSRFNAQGQASAQMERLAAELRERGLVVTTLVSDRDDYDVARWPLSDAMVRRSALHEAALEHRWRRYLATGGGHPHRAAWSDALVGAGMAVKRVIRAQRAAAVRLINIDLSHLRVMDAALADGAAWALIVEDDARVDDVGVAADRVAEVVRLATGSPLELVNLSESIDLTRLGVRGIVGGPALVGAPDWLVAASRPVTNTVCATLYRAPLLAELAAGIRQRGLVPVAPIDWRVNEQLMLMHRDGRLGDRSCAWVRPGPFVQGSMHPA